jgi:uncharacterized protein (TIGR00251 family)
MVCAMARRISVSVKPNARQTRVVKLSEEQYTVSVNAPAQDGRANEALIDALAGYFGVPKSRIKIVHGYASRRKRVEIG